MCTCFKLESTLINLQVMHDRPVFLKIYSLFLHKKFIFLLYAFNDIWITYCWKKNKAGDSNYNACTCCLKIKCLLLGPYTRCKSNSFRNFFDGPSLYNHVPLFRSFFFFLSERVDLSKI